jgi:hypothetical protein
VVFYKLARSFFPGCDDTCPCDPAKDALRKWKLGRGYSMMARERRQSHVWTWAFALLFACLLGASSAQDFDENHIPLPSYHYGAKIPVECLKRSM